MTTAQNGATATTPAAPGFGAALKAARERRRISQSKLALHAGFDHSYVSRLESGSRHPTRDAVLALAGILDCDPAPLLIAAGYLPDDPGDVLRDEPALAGAYTVLQRPDVPDALKHRLRASIAGTVGLVELVARPVSPLTRREIEGTTSTRAHEGSR